MNVLLLWRKKMGRTDAEKPEEFIIALEELKEKCDVSDLKMSDYGIVPDEFPKMAANAKSAMAFLFEGDRMELKEEDCVNILNAAYQ